MAKSKEQKFLDAVFRKQKAASEKARLAFEETGDPEIVIQFLKKSKTAAAIQEPWIINAIQGFIQADRTDILKKAFLTRPGNEKKPRLNAMEKLLFAHGIEKRRKAGQTLSAALLTELEETGHGTLTGAELQREWTKLKNRYQAAKRITPEIAVTETADAIILTAHPAKWSFDLPSDGGAAAKTVTGFGPWSIRFPKK